MKKQEYEAMEKRAKARYPSEYGEYHWSDCAAFAVSEVNRALRRANHEAAKDEVMRQRHLNGHSIQLVSV